MRIEKLLDAVDGEEKIQNVILCIACTGTRSRYEGRSNLTAILKYESKYK